MNILKFIGYTILLTLALWLFLPFHSFGKVHAAPLLRKVVHTGSYSMDRNNLTQTEIDNLVQAVVAAIPNSNYIAIGTYLDYPSQIQMWANSIHAHRRYVWFRSAGVNAWQGTNGVPATETPTQYITDETNFLNIHNSFFWAGDIWEAVPDEPENGTYYQTHSLGDPANAADFNSFIQNAITQVNNTFTSIGYGNNVITSYVFTNPSISRDILTDQTATYLSAMGTDDYPETTCSTAASCGQAMQSELTTWIVPSHPAKSKHITFGPDVYLQMSEKLQADTYTKEFNAIKSIITNLDGITVWQAGANDNPKSRLFNYNNGIWTPRSAAAIVNNFFGQL